MRLNSYYTPILIFLLLIFAATSCSTQSDETLLTDKSSKKWILEDRVMADGKEMEYWGLNMMYTQFDVIMEFKLKNHRLKQWYFMPSTHPNQIMKKPSLSTMLDGTWKLKEDALSTKLKSLRMDTTFHFNYTIESISEDKLVLGVLGDNNKLWMTETYSPFKK